MSETTATERWSEPQPLWDSSLRTVAYRRTRLERCPEWGETHMTPPDWEVECPRCADSPEPGWVPKACDNREVYECPHGIYDTKEHLCFSGEIGPGDVCRGTAKKCSACHGTGHETQRMTVERLDEILVFLLKMYVPPRTVDGPSPSDPELQFALAIMESRESRR